MHHAVSETPVKYFPDGGHLIRWCAPDPLLGARKHTTETDEKKLRAASLSLFQAPSVTEPSSQKRPLLPSNYTRGRHHMLLANMVELLTIFLEIILHV